MIELTFHYAYSSNSCVHRFTAILEYLVTLHQRCSQCLPVSLTLFRSRPVARHVASPSMYDQDRLSATMLSFLTTVLMVNLEGMRQQWQLFRHRFT